jgi:hypothetical protein
MKIRGFFIRIPFHLYYMDWVATNYIIIFAELSYVSRKCSAYFLRLNQAYFLGIS